MKKLLLIPAVLLLIAGLLITCDLGGQWAGASKPGAPDAPSGPEGGLVGKDGKFDIDGVTGTAVMVAGASANDGRDLLITFDEDFDATLLPILIIELEGFNNAWAFGVNVSSSDTAATGDTGIKSTGYWREQKVSTTNKNYWTGTDPNRILQTPGHSATTAKILAATDWVVTNKGKANAKGVLKLDLSQDHNQCTTEEDEECDGEIDWDTPPHAGIPVPGTPGTNFTDDCGDAYGNHAHDKAFIDDPKCTSSAHDKATIGKIKTIKITSNGDWAGGPNMDSKPSAAENHHLDTFSLSPAMLMKLEFKATK